MTSYLPDRIPVVVIYVLITVVFFAAAEFGYRFGEWWKNRRGIAKEALVSAQVGVVLALLSFLVAFTVGIAASRFDVRRTLILTEANSIGTTELRARLLPEPYGQQSRDLLREYVSFRISSDDSIETLQRLEQESQSILDELWSLATLAAQQSPTPITSLYIASLNETIDIHAERIFAIEYSRVPFSIIFIVLVVGVLTFVAIGFNNNLYKARNAVILTIVVLVFSLVISLIIDLDRPNDGLLRVSQQPLIDLQEQLNADVASQ
jgi:hypothetical protein